MITIARENHACIKNMKIILKQGKKSAYCLKYDAVYKLVNNQERLGISELMQVYVVKGAHSLGLLSKIREP